ncbi:MAG: hypothetical protein ABI597_10960, partial [Gammaproteobacteria bacterium]
MKSRPATPESENPVDDKVNEASLEQATEETVVPIAVAQDGGAEPEFIDYDESANSNNKEKEKEKEKEKIEVQVEKSVAADTGALEDSRYQEMHDEKDVEINLDRAQISSIRRAQSLVDSLRWLNPVQYVIG